MLKISISGIMVNPVNLILKSDSQLSGESLGYC